jgi:hypothetical protein
MIAKARCWATSTFISLAVILLALASIQPARAQAKDFTVRAQSATTGIPEFARQAGIQILVSEPLVRGKQISAVSGSHSVEEGLAILLKGTGPLRLPDGTTYTVSLLRERSGFVSRERRAARRINLNERGPQPGRRIGITWRP